MAAAAALVAALASGCAPPPAPSANAADSGLRIDIRTPPGLRAQQTVDMLNSDWPIGPVGVRTLATPDMVESVEGDMERLWWDRPFTLHDIDVRAGAATLHIVSSYGAQQYVRIHTGDDTLVDRFDVTTETPKISSWRDVDAALKTTNARYAYQAAKITDSRCERVSGVNSELSLPLASIFKLYVLYAVADAVKAGTVNWDDQLVVTAKVKAVGSSGLDKLPEGAKVSVLTAAEKMIATSDNMATDLLIEKVGTGAVEKALVAAGHHDPAGMMPFPTMYELFSVGWGEPDLRRQWQQADAAERGQILDQVNSRTYKPDPVRAHIPASAYGVEWYGSPEDICKVHAALQSAAVGKAAPVKEILAAVPGIDLDRDRWSYLGAKAGGLPGDLTFSWYAVDKSGQPWALSFQLNWPRDHGPDVTGWMLSIIKQAFALLPVQR